MPLQVRKIHTYSEELFVEGGRHADQPLRRVAAAAVCVNPCAGRYVDDLSLLVAGAMEIGNTIAPLAVALMAPYPIQSYGKGALVGFAGEAEHAEAVLTTEFGDTMRRAAGGGKAWICHMAKRAVPGEAIDIPLAHKDAHGPFALRYDEHHGSRRADAGRARDHLLLREQGASQSPHRRAQPRQGNRRGRSAVMRRQLVEEQT